MTRRDILRMLLAAPMAATLDVEKLLWVPGQMVSVPAMPMLIPPKPHYGWAVGSGPGQPGYSWLTEVTFSNPTNDPISVILKSHGEEISTIIVPPKQVVVDFYSFRPVKDFSWQASNPGLVGHVWGYD